MSTVRDLVLSHSLGLVALAALVCALMSMLVIGFTEKARVLSGRHRLLWMAAVAAIAGVGVWTTHFVAMLGFRPDIRWGFDMRLTALSAVMGMVFVGVPLAAAALARRRSARAGCGAAAGFGIGSMHFTGMAALQGCAASHTSGTVMAALALGALFGAAATAIDKRGWRVPLASALLVLAVCTLHFTAMAGATLTIQPMIGGAMSLDPAMLGIVVAGAALMLFLTAFLSALHQTRLDARDARQAAVLARQAGLLSTALHNMTNGLVMIGADRRVILHNARAATLLHLEPGDLDDGITLEDFLRNVGLRNHWDEARIGRVIANHTVWMAQTDLIRLEQTFGNGDVVSVSCRPLEGGAIITFDDVTREYNAQSRMAYMAHHDALTGLPNRRAFQTRLEEALNGRLPLSLLVIDLDHFKEINDTLGHAAGDDLLVKVADRLREACGPHDFLARLGGDEMAVIHVHGEGEDAEALAARMIDLASRPFTLGETTLQAGCSIGVAATSEATNAASETKAAELLMQEADLALYQAKESGRGRFERFEPEMMESAARRRRMEVDIAAAIERGEFRLAFQPLIDIAGSRVAGFEALIRWSHPTRGAISPAEFIPEAERTGQIVPIGEWVLREACREAGAWPADVHVAINASPVQLRSPSFLLQVVSALGASGLRPDRLEIELTETAMVEDGTAIAATLSALRALGVRVSMDDFGTGYSSLAHLRNFELDRIKIDRSFVDAAPTDAGCRAVLRAVTQLGRELGVTTLGEGVETLEQLELLRELGCDAAQGFLLGHPLPADEVAGFIAQARRMPPEATAA